MLRRLLALLVVLSLGLVTATSALAAAGGGSSGFGGGGGGGGFSGGGGYSGGGYSGGGGVPVSGGFALVVVLLVVGFVLLTMISAAIATAKMRKRRAERVRAVELAAAEASDDDAAFAADTVTEQAAELFLAIQSAWDGRDRRRLHALVGQDLMVEWGRRLDDFDRKGWHNRVRVHDRPGVEYVGLVNRADDADDRVVVRITATTDDYVETRGGGQLMHNGQQTATMHVAEYWTLEKRDGQWRLLSIEQDAEGTHHLDSALVASPWGDDERLRQEAIAERAMAEAAPAHVSPAELVDVDFSGPARAKAMDLALADGRFDVDLIEASVRRAVSAWAEAVDGADTALEAVARPDAVRALLGDADGRTRTVVRGAVVEGVTISGLDAEAVPPTLTVALDVRGRRYVEDRDTAAILAGSRDREATFAEAWTLSLDGQGEWPWRVSGVGTLVA